MGANERKGFVARRNTSKDSSTRRAMTRLPTTGSVVFRTSRNKRRSAAGRTAFCKKNKIGSSLHLVLTLVQLSSDGASRATESCSSEEQAAAYNIRIVT